MRKFVLLLAILALPGLTFGQNDIYVMSGYADGPPGVLDSVPDSGVSVLNILPGPVGTPIVIDIVVESAAPWSAVTYAITADNGTINPMTGNTDMSGDADWLYDPNPALAWINGPTIPLADWNAPGGNVVSYGLQGQALGAVHDFFGMYTGFVSPQAVWHGVGTLPAGEQLVCQYTLNSAAPLVNGQSWLIKAQLDPMFAFGVGVTPPGNFSPTSLDLLVNVIPEPASALLLLGALPFLRRRR